MILYFYNWNIQTACNLVIMIGYGWNKSLLIIHPAIFSILFPHHDHQHSKLSISLFKTYALCCQPKVSSSSQISSYIYIYIFFSFLLHERSVTTTKLVDPGPVVQPWHHFVSSGQFVGGMVETSMFITYSDLLEIVVSIPPVQTYFHAVCYIFSNKWYSIHYFLFIILCDEYVFHKNSCNFSDSTKETFSCFDFTISWPVLLNTWGITCHIPAICQQRGLSCSWLVKEYPIMMTGSSLSSLAVNDDDL